jgi:hypothetical protein
MKLALDFGLNSMYSVYMQSIASLRVGWECK